VEAYLERVTPLLDQDLDELTEPDWRSTVGRTLQQQDRMLISDIDGTLIGDGPDAEALERLRLALEGAGIGFGVASGRSLELVERAIERFGLPEPQVIVCDVGSDVRYGPARQPDRGYRHHLKHGWRPDEVLETLQQLGIEPQPEGAQTPRKLSFFLRDPSRLPEIERALDERQLRRHLIWSHQRFLDVLPHRAGKGKAIRYLANKWGLDPKRIVVAGDSGNDTEMLTARFPAIVVGNHAAELDELRGRRGVHFVDAPHARGVLQGLEELGFLAS
jgi:sucrose-phosphate synthase